MFPDLSTLCNVSSDEAGVTTNSLRLASVSRALADKVVTCEAANTDLGLPRHAALQLDLVTAPTHVNLSCAVAGAAVAADSCAAVVVSEGAEAVLRCAVAGARPAPDITWRVGAEEAEAGDSEEFSVSVAASQPPASTQHNPVCLSFAGAPQILGNDNIINLMGKLLGAEHCPQHCPLHCPLYCPHCDLCAGAGRQQPRRVAPRAARPGQGVLAAGQLHRGHPRPRHQHQPRRRDQPPPAV